MQQNSGPSVFAWGTVLLLVAVIGIISIAWGCPQYNVWQKELKGKATLREAEWDRQVAIEEAKAKLESAQHFADAEIIRASGVAEANKIIGSSLEGSGGEAYLRYLWIMGLQDGTSEIIYIPTEGQLPILEATRGLTNKAN